METIKKKPLMARWDKEGRWPEVQRFMVDSKAEYLEKGMSAEEAANLAWAAAELNFPSLNGVEEVPKTSKGRTKGAAVPATSKKLPWKDLPAKADFTAEIEWVHQQFALIVSETPKGRVVSWFNATSSPPSYGACSLALWAADNRTAFYKDVLPRAMAAESKSKDDAEDIKEEKRSIAEVQRILEKIAGS